MTDDDCLTLRAELREIEDALEAQRDILAAIQAKAEAEQVRGLAGLIDAADTFRDRARDSAEHLGECLRKASITP